MSILWLVGFAGFLLLEASTVTVVSVWFAVGSLAAMVAAMLSAPLWLQVVLFLVVSAGCLLLLRPVTRKYLKPNLCATNTDAVLGTVGVVTEDIDNIRACGQVKMGAMFWSARSSTGEPIPAGTQVTADRVEGVKLFVTPVPVAAMK